MFLTAVMIIVSVTIVALLSVVFIRRKERLETDQMLLLLCETGERNLDHYFDSVQESVAKVASYAEYDIDGLETEKLEDHVTRIRDFFEAAAGNTNGVLTYYYRIDPEISETVKGFWYTNLDGTGFREHDVTDITLYDTQDTSKLVWFTVPKNTGKPVWLPPYITDNLDVRVVSHNKPISWKNRFVGVVGIELDYSMIAEQVSSIRLYSNGYAFLTDEKGNLFYHPRIDVAELTEETMPEIPEGLVSDSTFVKYTFDGVEKWAAWLPLSNGMRLIVSIPVSDTDGDWQRLIREILIVSAVVLLTMGIFTMIYAGHIIKPLVDLTHAAEQAAQGNYDFDLEYFKDDEIGRLTTIFKRMASHTKDHISDLNKRVYVDALTSVKNKGAFTNAVDVLQKQLDENEISDSFGIGLFDCDDLKAVNDQYGHDKGDIYLKTACRLICNVFHHSPVFRIGGDEFAVILRNDDYENREELIRSFHESAEKISAAARNKWEQVSIAMGIAVYDSQKDRLVIDTVRRADRLMYADKRVRKQDPQRGTVKGR